jgi:hypothetical protein
MGFNKLNILKSGNPINCIRRKPEKIMKPKKTTFLISEERKTKYSVTEKMVYMIKSNNNEITAPFKTW